MTARGRAVVALALLSGRVARGDLDEGSLRALLVALGPYLEADLAAGLPSLPEGQLGLALGAGSGGDSLALSTVGAAADRATSKAAKETVRDLFAYWQRRCDHTRARFTPERGRAISARLREGYTPADIRAAIDGAAESPFHQGENDRGRRYDDITLICRSGAKLEGFIDHAGERPSGADGGNAHHDRREQLESLIAATRARAAKALKTGDRDEYERTNERLRSLLRRAADHG